MSDNYQPIYDAMKSSLRNCDVGTAVENVFREANLSFYFENACTLMAYYHSGNERPSVLMRPALSIDGDVWCALYGDNLQDGVAGFGKSPADAMLAFDKAWTEKLK